MLWNRQREFTFFVLPRMRLYYADVRNIDCACVHIEIFLLQLYMYRRMHLLFI